LTRNTYCLRKTIGGWREVGKTHRKTGRAPWPDRTLGIR